jgi:hypothetical protein
MLVALVCAYGLADAAPQSGPSPRLSVALSCPSRAGKGRIVCELQVVAPEAHILRWADALVVEAPDFALPLRVRVAGQLAEEGVQRAQIAIPLFATEENTGALRVRARAALCPLRTGGACIPSSREVTASVAVVRANP